MKNIKNCLTLLLLVFLNQNIYSQTTVNNWRKSPVGSIVQVKGKRSIQPEAYTMYQIDFQLLKTKLNDAPKIDNNNDGLKIAIPTPTGIENFIVSKTDVLAEQYQAVDAEIQTFFGYKESEPNVWISLDYTNHGFHAMITGTKDGDYFIDPYQMNDTENYLVYYKKDNLKNKTFECFVKNESLLEDFSEGEIGFNKNAIESDCKLRTYRLAIGCTGEYTAFHGGTQALAQSGIATTINRVNQMFRRDFGAVLNIVSGTSIIFVDSITDPYINGDIYSLLGDNEAILDAIIGVPNYDIGHVFGTAGFTSGGLATREGICLSPDKGAGVTILESPIGDQFDIDFVAHEIAHQFGARHTFNSYVGACSGYLQRNPVSAYEPGSGSTIMAYAGLCAEPPGGINTNVQEMTDAMFHAYTIYEISKGLITGNASLCGTVALTVNNKPVADAGPVFYNIPVNTPFELTGNSTDSDAADIHTYSWEQYDLAPTGITATPGGLPPVLPGQNIPISTSTDQPNFRAYLPTTNKTRYIPTLDSLVANVMWPKYEVIPSVTRSVKFRLTVRDNSTSGCGCTDYDEIDINFDGTKGPFLVNYPNATGITWTAATSQTVTWNVAGTTNYPVSCANVDILMSTDGGYTYPHVLASNVPNDGSQSITVPNIGTTTARVKVICSDNIFFDISDNNFTITAVPVSGPQISFQTTLLETFEENNPDGDLDCRPYKDYTVTMQIANPPTGDAIVSINLGGNATNIFDYRILGAPITFQSGSTADQSFTVRIIDDGEVDPLENLELTYTITGTTNAFAGNSDQTCLVKINDDEHAPFAGANPHFDENFDSGVTFGAGTTNWNDANNSGGENWTLGTGGDLSASGQSLYISDNGVSNSYNTSNSYNYVSIESPQINGVGKTNQVLTFDYISGGDAGHDYGRLAYDNGTTGVILIEGGSNAPFVNVNNKKRASIVLPDAVNGSNFNLTWGWTNSVTNPGGIAGKGFEIDNIRVTEGTPGIRIETEITTTLDEQYLGPFQSIYFYDPKDENLMLYIENTSSHDYGCTTVEIDRAGKGATEFQFVDPMLDVTDKTYKVIPTNNNINGTYNVTLFYTEEEISGWENSTGNSRAIINIVKTISNISIVTPSNQQLPTTIYKPVTLGSFGTDVTLTSTFNSGFSGFAAGIKIDPLPIELLNFNATLLENRTVRLDWSTSSEINNDYFLAEKSIDGTNWEYIAQVDGAGNSIQTIDYIEYDFNVGNGVTYYRLKQVDFDGNYSYSNVRSVNLKLNENEILIYPNPTNGFITIKGSAQELKNLQVLSVLGQDITNQVKLTIVSKNEIDLNLGELSKGVYFIKTKENTVKVILK